MLDQVFVSHSIKKKKEAEKCLKSNTNVNLPDMGNLRRCWKANITYFMRSQILKMYFHKFKLTLNILTFVIFLVLFFIVSWTLALGIVINIFVSLTTNT